ncbi:MAG: metal ABC transporter permease [Planctomycetota bacterium]
MIETLLDPGTQGTLLVAILACSSCALIGCFLVLRGMSLLGDAISHAVLPGIVIAFMVTGDRAPVPLLLGAVAAGLLTTFLTQSLHQRAKVESDAGMGVVFTTLFAIGVLLINAASGQNIELDPDCVLFGDLGDAVLRTTEIRGRLVPSPVIPLGIALTLNVVLITLLWKELAVSAFDPKLATTLGISATAMHYTVMAAVSCTSVAAFESVGSILVIAMLIVPGTAARLLTDRLFPMVTISVGFAMVTAVIGILLATKLDTYEAPTLAVTSGVLLAIAVVFAPRHGIAVRWLRRVVLSLRIVAEDILARIYRHQERQRHDGQLPILGLTFRGLAHSVKEGAIFGGRGTCRLALWALGLRGYVRMSASGYRLTPLGEKRASELVRSHRAWEVYLNEQLGTPLDHLHEPAHRMEHYLSPELTQAILEQTDEFRDPHGRPSPHEPSKRDSE